MATKWKHLANECVGKTLRVAQKIWDWKKRKFYLCLISTHKAGHLCCVWWWWWRWPFPGNENWRPKHRSHVVCNFAAPGKFPAATRPLPPRPATYHNWFSCFLCVLQSPPKGATIPYRPKPQVNGPVILANGQAYTIQGNFAVPTQEVNI